MGGEQGYGTKRGLAEHTPKFESSFYFKIKSTFTPAQLMGGEQGYLTRTTRHAPFLPRYGSPTRSIPPSPKFSSLSCTLSPLPATGGAFV